MRFVVVYQDDASDARRLLAYLGISDVRLIVAKAREHEPGTPEAQVLRANPGARVAALGVHRKYRKALAVNFACRLEIELNEFRPNDRQLLDWLNPPTVIRDVVLTPSAAFLQVSHKQPLLVIAEGALRRADEITRRRHPFMTRAANGLCEVAAMGAQIPGGLRQWCPTRSLDFAPNGKVYFDYRVYCDALEPRAYTTQWHLKEGDRTTSDDAARIYFDIVDVKSRKYVVILYCGPHPDEKTYKVDVEIS